MNEQFRIIAEKIKQEDFFKRFKFRKRDYRFSAKGYDTVETVLFHVMNGYDLENSREALCVKPLYFKRFDVLHQWFEKFSFKSLSDQRDAFSVAFDGNTLPVAPRLEYFFFDDSGSFEKQYALFSKEIIENATIVFENFDSLSKLFEYQVLPVIEGKAKLPRGGADHLFFKLKLARIMDIEVYNRFKSIVIDEIKELIAIKEPNIMKYESKLGAIFDDLE